MVTPFCEVFIEFLVNNIFFLPKMEVFPFFESVPELESFEVPVNETSSHISTPGTGLDC